MRRSALEQPVEINYLGFGIRFFPLDKVDNSSKWLAAVYDPNSRSAPMFTCTAILTSTQQAMFERGQALDKLHIRPWTLDVAKFRLLTDRYERKSPPENYDFLIKYDDEKSDVVSDEEIKLEILKVANKIRHLDTVDYIQMKFPAWGLAEVLGTSLERVMFWLQFFREEGMMADRVNRTPKLLSLSITNEGIKYIGANMNTSESSALIRNVFQKHCKGQEVDITQFSIKELRVALSEL